MPVQLPARRTSAPAPTAKPVFVVSLTKLVVTGFVLAVAVGVSTGISTGTSIGLPSSSSWVTTVSITLSITPGVTVRLAPVMVPEVLILPTARPPVA